MEAIQPIIIYQETNPYGSMTAFLEDDGRTIYLYLQSEEDPEKPIRTVWVKNRIPGPESRNPQDLKDGLAPVLCKDEVDQNDYDSFHPEDIHFIWLEEGDGLGLFYRDELVAFLPPWSGVKGFHGYSKFAKLESITAFPLGNSDNGVIAERIEKSRKYWEFRSDISSWKEIQKLRLDYLEKHLGPHQKYWSADGGKFPQLAIVKFTPDFSPNIVFYSTIGMSAQNMPSVELFHRDYLDYSRVELIFAHKISDQDNTETWVPHVIGEIIKFPWMMDKWFGEGHNITLSRRDPDALYLNFTNLLISSQLPSYNGISLPCKEELISENGKKINFLYLLPITEEEVFLMKQEGASSLLNLIEKSGEGWAHNSERQSFL
ncbi:MAG: suppressor of fused domain protein [Leptospiraceae bacterium]|nr:suppressor of fused domain protein [Leptospiraceae bacterium]